MSRPKQKRLDELLVERGLCPTRNKAQLAIRSGQVLVNNNIADKPGKTFLNEIDIGIKTPMPYVSRGGIKIEAAIKSFSINVKNKTCLDIGASTGGFTDCLLQYGASLVYAVDVGYGQLDLKLRNDERVIVMEKINARYLTPERFPQKPDIITIDVSFISLDKIFPPASKIIKDPGSIIALIKPQFEAGKKHSKKGVVKDPAIHDQVIDNIIKTASQCNLKKEGLIPSPILGPAGNKEFLLYLKKI